MECPHCGNDTDPTLLYCKVCGEAMELDEEQVSKAMERDTELEAVEEMELQSRGALYLSIFILVSVIALRMIALRPVVADVAPGYYVDSKILENKGVEPATTLELDPIPIEIPNDKRTNRYDLDNPPKIEPKKDEPPKKDEKK